jgi:hypothetical protein
MKQGEEMLDREVRRRENGGVAVPRTLAIGRVSDGDEDRRLARAAIDCVSKIAVESGRFGVRASQGAR